MDGRMIRAACVFGCLTAALVGCNRNSKQTNLIGPMPNTEGAKLVNMPLDTAVRLVAEAGGLKPIQVGNVMLVTTKALANEMRNDPELMTGAQTPQQEIQMLQQKRMLMLQQQQFAPPIFQSVIPPPPPAAPVEGEKKAEQPPADVEKKTDKPGTDK